MNFFNNQKLKSGFLTPLILWLLIWGGYNTSPWRLGKPENLLDLFHGIRALFPILAGFLAFILLKKGFFSKKTFKTPLGLLLFYTLVGIFSSIFLSARPLVALYWAFSYSAVILVLFSILSNLNSRLCLSWLININWFIVLGITISLFIFLLVQPGTNSSIITFNFLGKRPYAKLAAQEAAILGMPVTRPTGFGRYAGIAALVAMAKLLSSKKKLLKLNWFFFFVFSYFLLLFSQSNMAIFGFIFSSYLIFLLKSESKIYIFCWSFLTLFQLILVIIFLFGPHLEKVAFREPVLDIIKEILAPVYTLRGRTVGDWPECWKLFLKSPLVGFGFHADRIFLGRHTHNAILHALIQAGIAGALPFISAFVWAWSILFSLFRQSPIRRAKSPLLSEIIGVLAFLTIRGIAESTGAFFWSRLDPFSAPFGLSYNFKARTVSRGQKLTNMVKKDIKRIPSIQILGSRVHMVQIPEVVELMAHWIEEEGKKCHWIIVTGMHGIMEAYKGTEFKEIVNSSDLFVPDGISLIWAARYLGFPLKRRVSGSDLMKEFFKLASKKGYTNFFYGDTEEVLELLTKKLIADFPDLKIAGSYSPPFRALTSEEDAEIIELINQEKPDVLWVALGLPKQERWVFEHRDKLNVPVVIGVGAAFKFLSGKIKRVPPWMGEHGLEWIWRFLQEPRSLWRRVF